MPPQPGTLLDIFNPTSKLAIGKNTVYKQSHIKVKNGQAVVPPTAKFPVGINNFLSTLGVPIGS